MPVQLGVIADDFTGATDIASFLVTNGLKTIQLNGLTGHPALPADVQAVVISLKSRSIPARDAISQSLAALELLRDYGAERFFFKYCSTFDSTTEGNIGPVTDALLGALEQDFTVVCPALPINGRTTYQGYLFVNGVPLHESGMRNHPVTPMRDSSLVRLMEGQASGRAGIVNVDTVEAGTQAVEARLQELRSQGVRYAVLDATNATHLNVLGEATRNLRLLTGGSGLGGGLASALRAGSANDSHEFVAKAGRTVVLSGSCSVRTNEQVVAYRDLAPSLAVDVDRLVTAPQGYVQEVLEWFAAQPSEGPAPLIYATSGPEEVQRLQESYGAETTSNVIEGFFGRLAEALADFGVERMIVAGGETSGAVTTALKVDGFEVGPTIAPGVPWVRSLNGSIDLALKSGNFGTVDFFSEAQQ